MPSSSDVCERATCCAYATSCGSPFSNVAHDASQSCRFSRCDRSCASCGVYHDVGPWYDAGHGLPVVDHDSFPAWCCPLSIDQHDEPLQRHAVFCDGAADAGDSPELARMPALRQSEWLQ